MIRPVSQRGQKSYVTFMNSHIQYTEKCRTEPKWPGSCISTINKDTSLPFITKLGTGSNTDLMGGSKYNYGCYSLIFH